MKSKSYRLPNGKYTSSPAIYFKEWRKLYNPIEKSLGVKLIGCDPGLLFSYFSTSFSICPSLATKIVEVIEKANKYDKLIGKDKNND